MKHPLTMLVGIGLLQGCASLHDSQTDLSEPCSDATLAMIAQQVPTGDGLGHGPDTGSEEWHSVVEFRLGVRGDASVPARHTRRWCRFIEVQLDDSN